MVSDFTFLLIYFLGSLLSMDIGFDLDQLNRRA
jgi:hypothetical protein